MGIAIVTLCQHFMDNAARCRCPAMRGTRYCYSHQRKREQGAKKSAERVRQRWFASAMLEDAASVQRALLQVMTRLVSGSVDHKQAGQILYKLQSASVNLRSAGCGLGKADDESSPNGRAINPTLAQTTRNDGLPKAGHTERALETGFCGA